MASEVGIYNLALSHLSKAANLSSPGEQSAEAQYCRQFYTMARDQLLVSHAWGFCTKRVALSLLTNDVDSWAYAYARPNDMLEPIALLLPESADDTLQQDFIQELNGDDAQVIRTNVESAVLRYTKRVEDTTRFTPLFTIALAYLLAAYMAGPMTHDEKKQQWCLRMANSILAQAKANDANGQMNESYGAKHRPSFLARGSELTLLDTE